MNLPFYMHFVVGDDGNNTLTPGNTVNGKPTAVFGYGGQDYLSGHYMYGGTGDDTYFIDSFSDRVVEKAGEGIDRVISNVTYYTLPNHVENLDLFSIVINGVTSGAEIGIGNNLGNTIKGNGIANSLEGHGGNDFLFAYSGDDGLNGGAGNDFADGGAGSDWVWGTNNANYGKNEIDTLIGGAGADNFVVGADSSLYYVGNFSNDYALIRDFEIGVDKIHLTDLGDNSKYVLTNVPGNLGGGVGIAYQNYIGNGQIGNDLIAVIQGANVSAGTINLNDASIFQYA